jgi:hypothetical protein
MNRNRPSSEDSVQTVAPVAGHDEVTLNRQVNPFTTIALVSALEDAWNAVRANHPDVPEAVIILGSGTATRAAKWGHYGSLRWQHGHSRLPEVLISGEGLKRPADQVFTTLLHEAAHGLADARGIKDTSRQGRWHNQKFANLANELGLQPHQDGRLGWSPCTLPPETEQVYARQLAALARALSAYRHPEIHLEVGRKTSTNGLVCLCSCPRRIRVARAVLEEGTITCDVCGDPFEPTTAGA